MAKKIDADYLAQCAFVIENDGDAILAYARRQQAHGDELVALVRDRMRIAASLRRASVALARHERRIGELIAFTNVATLT